MTSNPSPLEPKNIWANQPVDHARIPLADVRKAARRLRRRVILRNSLEYATAALVLVWFGSGALNLEGGLARLGSLLIAVATLYAMAQLRIRASARTPAASGVTSSYLAFHRAELERQRTALKSVWRWYLAPFVPGMSIIIIDAAIRQPRGAWFIAALGAVALFVGIHLVNRRAARRLDRKIDELDEIASRDALTPSPDELSCVP